MRSSSNISWADRQLIRAMAYVVRSEGVEPQHVARAGNARRAGRACGGISITPRIGVEAVRRVSGTAMAMAMRTAVFHPKRAFLKHSRKPGFELRMKDLQIYAGGMKKGDWDVGMTVDVIRMMSFLDVIILVTGDGDFIPLVNYVKWGGGTSGRDRLVQTECIVKNRGSRG